MGGNWRIILALRIICFPLPAGTCLLDARAALLGTDSAHRTLLHVAGSAAVVREILILAEELLSQDDFETLVLAQEQEKGFCCLHSWIERDTDRDKHAAGSPTTRASKVLLPHVHASSRTLLLVPVLSEYLDPTLRAHLGALESRALASPLHLATRSNDGALVAYLVQHWYGSLEQQDKYGNTALHYVAYHGNLELLRALMLGEQICSGDVEDSGGQPPVGEDPPVGKNAAAAVRGLALNSRSSSSRSSGSSQKNGVDQEGTGTLSSSSADEHSLLPAEGEERWSSGISTQSSSENLFIPETIELLPNREEQTFLDVADCCKQFEFLDKCLERGVNTAQKRGGVSEPWTRLTRHAADGVDEDEDPEIRIRWFHNAKTAKTETHEAQHRVERGLLRKKLEQGLVRQSLSAELLDCGLVFYQEWKEIRRKTKAAVGGRGLTEDDREMLKEWKAGNRGRV